MPTFIKTGFWEKLSRAPKEYLNLDNLIQSLIHPSPPPVSTYKVYTALLTQSGVSDELSLDSGLLTIGVTYLINRDTSVYGADFTIVGAPNNTLGTMFVATGTTPNWGTTPIIDMLTYDPGAPVATVLENTIGNIVWLRAGAGIYRALLTNAFTLNKTHLLCGTLEYLSNPAVVFIRFDQNVIHLLTSVNGNVVDDLLTNFSIEIRVYN